MHAWNWHCTRRRLRRRSRSHEWSDRRGRSEHPLRTVGALAAEGYAIALAENGSEALRLFSEQSPDVVCLDIMMPGTSGYDVCRKIRQADAGVRVLFISAKSEEIDKVVARIRAVTRRRLDQHIAQLRKRVELDPRQPQITLTVHGAGYRYDG